MARGDVKRGWRKLKSKCANVKADGAGHNNDEPAWQKFATLKRQGRGVIRATKLQGCIAMRQFWQMER